MKAQRVPVKPAFLENDLKADILVSDLDGDLTKSSNIKGLPEFRICLPPQNKLLGYYYGPRRLERNHGIETGLVFFHKSIYNIIYDWYNLLYTNEFYLRSYFLVSSIALICLA